MPDLLQVFRDKAEELISAINRKGGVRATIESLRRQMEAADRRRAMNKVKAELKRLDRQINEMITAVGVQAIGLHEAGKLASPELQPLCQHILDLKATLAQQETELANLQAVGPQEKATSADHCPACSKLLPGECTFCPYCGAALPAPKERFCTACGASLRPKAQFCAKCGQTVNE